jgi:hypothetical protein
MRHYNYGRAEIGKLNLARIGRFAGPASSGKRNGAGKRT